MLIREYNNNKHQGFNKRKKKNTTLKFSESAFKRGKFPFCCITKLIFAGLTPRRTSLSVKLRHNIVDLLYTKTTAKIDVVHTDKNIRN